MPSEEVKVHEPEAFSRGGRTVSGKLALKPIARTELRFSPRVIAVAAGAAVAVFGVSWVLGRMGVFQAPYRLITQGVGLLLVSPPLVVFGYIFLRHEEDLAPLQGWHLWLRAAGCGAGYALLWWVFETFGKGFLDPEQVWTWAVVAPAFLALGAVVAIGSLELEPGDAFLHYSMYLVVTILLRWTASLGWVWELPRAGPLV